MKVELAEIPGFDARYEKMWKVRALAIDNKNPALAALVNWQKHRPNDFRAILKVMRIAAQQDRVRNPKHVKKCGNPKHGEVYEMIAYTSTSRLMFFYDNDGESLIVCTNEHEKKGDQDAAFERCATLKAIYLASK